LRPNGPKPALFSKKEGELSLSGPVLSDLLREVLEKRVPIRFRVKGFSMSPFIKDGDMVTVSPFLNGQPHMGDVVTFTNPKTKRLIMHRVVGKRGDSYLIRADSAIETDGQIPMKNIIGRVTKVERNGKRIILGLGPERLLIAFLIRRGLLFPLLPIVWKIIHPLFYLQPFAFLKILLIGK